MAIPLAAQHVDSPSEARVHAWEKTALTLLAVSFLLRLIFIGVQELIPEEAYYWQFSHHLAWSYLDHPPMVAWLISAGTAIFGHNEFGVRIGALLCSALAAVFLWKLAKLLFDREAALLSVMLFAALPYFFISGFLITPDSPLILFWTATLYFLVRALRDGSSRAWLGVGICIGLGMISKYTIALLGLAIILFMLAHKPSRRWFFSPWPYVAACLSIVLFTPVIYWNATHEWASFAFQTSRRLEAPTEFGLHTLIISIFCLVTPTGMIAAWLAVRSPAARETPQLEFRALFLRIFLAFPILVFTLFSLTHEPKLNWTGPAFIVALPFIAAMLCTPQDTASRLQRFVQASWLPTFVILFVTYTGAFLYFGIGIPGVAYARGSQRYVGWTDLGRQLSELVADKQKSKPARILIVGMDKHFLASEIGFYTPASTAVRPLPREAVAGRSIFGMNSLMWELWQPVNLDGVSLLLVARSREDLEKPEILHFVAALDDVTEILTHANGSISGRYFYRWAYGYHANSGNSSQPQKPGTP